MGYLPMTPCIQKGQIEPLLGIELKKCACAVDFLGARRLLG